MAARARETADASGASKGALSSWRDGPAKNAILAFVAATSGADGSDPVPVEERVAVFDNDGTLWSEQPVYFQLAFALDRVKALADNHPEWTDRPPTTWRPR